MLKTINLNLKHGLMILVCFCFILFSGVIIKNYVLAADDNIVYPICRSSSGGMYCDSQQINCTDVVGSGRWLSNGYPGGAGYAMCCGDDRQEYPVSRIVNNIVSGVFPSFSSSSSDKACCPANSETYCVYNGACFSDNSVMDNGNICLKPVSGSSLEPRAWYDCDDSDGYNDFCVFCGHGDQIKSGEGGVGEYSALGAYGCCGDDLGEYSQLSPGAGLDTQWLGTSSFVCCDSSTDCVKDNKCYNEGAYNDLNPGGNDNFAVCSNIDNSWNVYDGSWYDCDFNWKYNLNLSSCAVLICGSSSGVKAGESNVGEYTDTTTNECCGDDANEYYKSGICCNSNTDINSSGHCCPSGTVWNGSVCVAPNSAPSKPTNLKQFDDVRQMSEGDSTLDTTPYFTFTISDPNSGDIVGYQIQIDNDSKFSSPTVIDYPWGGSTTNPNNVRYDVPSETNLILGSYYWRVRAKDGAGLYSDWADDINGYLSTGVDFRIVAPTCGDNALSSGVERDFNSSLCSSGWAMTTGNSPSQCWITDYCCGDDSTEYIKSRAIDKTCSGNNCPSFSSSSSDKACCSISNNCVYNGTCYNYTTSLSVNNSTEFCDIANSIDSGLWTDPDELQLAGGEDVRMCEYLDFIMAKAGEASVGEYSDTTTDECCGDDANEYYKSGICCNSNTDVNSSGHCCPSGQVWNGSACALPNIAPTITSLKQYDDNGQMSEGAWTRDTTPYFTFTISDANAGDTVGYQIQIDNDSGFSSPAVIDYIWGGSTTNPNGVTFNVPATACASTSGYVSGSTCPLLAGTYYWRARAKDIAGLYSNWADDNNGYLGTGSDFKIDLTAPICGVVTYNPSDWTNGSVTVTVGCSDSGSGCTQSSYTKAVTENGTGSIAIADNVGNTNNCAYNVTKIDKILPTVSGAQARPDSYTDTGETDDDTEIYFTWNSDDTGGSGLKDCYADINDSTPNSSVGVDGRDVKIGIEGLNTYYVYCEDNAGNKSSTISDTITVSIDSEAPIISFNPVSRSWSNTNVSVQVIASDPSGVASTLYCWQSNSSCAPTISFTNGSSLTQTASDSWNLCVKATDTDGNSRTQCSGLYNIDKNNPSVSGAPTSSGGWKQSGTGVTLSVTDSLSGIFQAKYSWNNTDPKNNGTAFTHGENITSPCSGGHTLYLWARDNAGNEATWNSSSQAYKCDLVNPVVNELKVDGIGKEGSPVSNTDGTPTVYFEVSDTGGSGLNYVEVYRRDGPCGPDTGWNLVAPNITVSGNSDSDSWTDSVANGTYCYGIHVNDNCISPRWADEGSQGPIEVSVLTGGGECFGDGDCSPTICPADGCYGPKLRDYPISVANTCVGGVCTHNSCSAISSLCSVSSCGAECDAGHSCSTSYCSAYSGQTYLQTRVATCQSNCTCANWSSFQSCEQSYNSCSVECYTGTGCNTASNVCKCQTGYIPNGTGRCELTDGGGGGENNAPNTPTNLKQFDEDGQMNESDETEDQTPYFTFDVSDPDTGDIVGYQIQIDTDNTFSAPDIYFEYIGSDVTPASFRFDVPASCPGSGYIICDAPLVNSNYYWRVRAKDGEDLYSAWAIFGSAPVDFTVNAGEAGGNQVPTAEFEYCKVAEDILWMFDKSTDADGVITSWDWNFGDGENCTASGGCSETGYNGTNQDPVHTFGATVNSEPTGDWADWNYGMVISFDNATRGNLINVPVLIKLTSANFNFSQAQSNGQDIRFVDSNAITALNYEIENWDFGAQTAYIWVKVPQIDGGSNNDFIYMYWGNATIPDGQNKTAVWSAYAGGVYHLNNSSFTSATGNYNGTNYGSTDTSGYIAGARSFDGINDRIATTYSPNHGDFTYEGMYYRSVHSHGTLMKTQYFDGNDNQEIRFGFRAENEPNGAWEVWTRDNNGDSSDWLTYQPSTSLYNGWHYVVITRDESADDFIFYVDGQLVESDLNSGADGTISFNDGDHAKLYLEWGVTVMDEGSGLSRERWWNGKLDELRFSTNYKDADWVSFQYCSITQSCIHYNVSLSSQITLEATDNEGAKDSEIKTVDINTVPDCQFYLNQVQGYNNCSAIALAWSNPTAWTPDNYKIYRSTDSNCDANPGSCSWSLAHNQSSSEGPSYDDSNVSEGVTYWYYISTDPISLNNSRVTGSCAGGFGTSGNRCPMSATVVCATTPSGISSTHRCGAIILGWDKVEDAVAYKLQRSVGYPASESSYSDILTKTDAEIDAYCASTESQCANECCYTDEDVITVNTVYPSNNEKYWYRVGVQAEDESWAWSDVLNDYSYCYQAPNWQER